MSLFIIVAHTAGIEQDGDLTRQHMCIPLSMTVWSCLIQLLIIAIIDVRLQLRRHMSLPMRLTSLRLLSVSSPRHYMSVKVSVSALAL